MKKERILKYLILIYAMVASFFIFASQGVNALEEYSVNDGKVTLQLEAKDNNDLSKGYVIVGATTTCEPTNHNCITDWQMPSSYTDSNPIVEIASGDSLAGVLENISKVISGKVTVGENIETLGKCAFCNFDYVEEVVLQEQVATIGEYAFAHNDLLKVIEIKAYNNVKTELANVNAFNSSPFLKKISFKNVTVLKNYRNSVSGWDLVESAYSNITFTYKVYYYFYDGDGNLTAGNIVSGYVGEILGAVPSEITKVGFNFKWVSKRYSNEITASSIVVDSGVEDSVTLDPIHEVIPVWSLKSPTVYMQTNFNGNIINHTESVKKIIIAYEGKNRVLNILPIIEHELLNDPSLSITYSWDTIINSISSTSVSSENHMTAARVADTGAYTCNITFSYPGYDSLVESVTINVKITPKDLIINFKDLESEYGTFLESKENVDNTYYEIDSTTPLLDGEKVKISFDGYYQKKDVGTYENVLNGEVVDIGYDGDIHNYVSDYNIQYNPGNLKITPKELPITLEENIEIEYGSQENLTVSKNYEIYGEQKEVIIKYVREDADNKNVGQYDVISASAVKGNNEDTNFDVILNSVNEGKIVILAKKVNVEWTIDENLVYSGIEKDVSAKYKDLSNNDIELDVEIKKNGFSSILVNAGTYNLVASMEVNNSNYELVSFEKELVIERADSVFIGAQRQVTTYNGKPQRVTVELNHSEGMVVYGDYNSCKNAHMSTSSTCTISVSVEETENYKALSGNFYLHINPYELVVEPDLFEFNYGTAIGQYNLHSKYDGVNGEKVSVYFAKEGSSSPLNVGFYNIVSAYIASDINYKATMVSGSGINKIKINPAPIEVRFMNYEGLVYDGTVKNIGIRYFGTEEDVGLVANYGNKIIKNAGDYRIDVSVTNENFYIEGTNYLEFSIAKATYDISGLKLEDAKVKFNFKSHFINLKGELPKGLIAVYTIDGEHGNGTYMPSSHTIKVSFEGDFENYNYVAPLTATLKIDMSWVWWTLFIVVFIFAVVPVTLWLLVKYNVIKVKSVVRRRVVRKLIKKSRELDNLNLLFKERKENLNKVNEEDEVLVIEEEVKFVKNVVKVPPEEQVELSFVDELFASSYGTKQFYSEVKNELLSYDGVVSKIKRDYETFYLNNMPIAKLDVVKGVLYVYFALDPTQYKEEEYHHEKVSKDKDFVSVPLKLKVDSIESLRHAKMFVRIIRKREGIKFTSNFIRVDYVEVYTSKDGAFKMFKKAFVKKGTKEYEED